ncbi:MAG TPA: zf-HC2 domain-containing protein, partial [Armatimonadota bacterium]|nr:zf-HC2 domain-containing protein [Armatimonadota bacterium]
MKCQKIRSDLKAYIDGELGFVARWRVARHLAVCEECKEEHKAMKELTEVLKSVAGVAVPSGFKQRVQAGLDAQTASTPAPVRRLSGRMKFAVAMIPLVIIAAFAFNEYKQASRREMMVRMPESELRVNAKTTSPFVPGNVDSKRLEGSGAAPVPSSVER